MAETILGKEADGYGYKYTDIAGIHRWLESKGLTYYQYVDTDENGYDYIYTVPIESDGTKHNARRGCRIVMATLNGKSNPAQEQGSAITYARRYSLLMAFGLATTDDDAACLTEEVKKGKVPGYPPREEMIKTIKKRYPDGSSNLTKLLESAEGGKKSIEEFSDAQVIAVFNKIGGR